MSTCTILQPPTCQRPSSFSGQYVVQYDLDLRDEGNTWPDVQFGPNTALQLARTSQPHAVPLPWSIYDLRPLDPVRYGRDFDESSFLAETQLEPLPNTKGDKWIVTTIYRRLNDDEYRQIYLQYHPRIRQLPGVLGQAITVPFDYYPIVQLRRFTLSAILDGGYPIEQIQSSPAYAPVSGKADGSALPPPWDGFQGITDSTPTQMITTANKLPSSTYVRTNIEFSLIAIRMNFATPYNFMYWDRQMRNTIWNGGDEWEANGGTGPASQWRGGGQTGHTYFFGCYEGQVRYQGGGVVGGARQDNGEQYWECEFRFELAYADWSAQTSVELTRNWELPFVTVVQNASNIEWDGQDFRVVTLQDRQRRDLPIGQPLYLSLDGQRDPDLRNPTQPFLHWWYGKPFDYMKVGNGIWTIGDLAALEVAEPQGLPVPTVGP